MLIITKLIKKIASAIANTLAETSETLASVFAEMPATPAVVPIHTAAARHATVPAHTATSRYSVGTIHITTSRHTAGTHGRTAMMMLIALLSSLMPLQAVHAQTSDLYDPLIPGAVATPPFIPAPHGQRPPIGNGPTPAPVIPGMGGPSTLLPWVPAVPANDIDLKNTGLSIPFGPPIATPPGVLGPLLTPLIPGPPSTPGPAPGSLTAPPSSFNPAEQTLVDPGGGLPGTGGFATTIPTIRRGGQQTHQWELRGRNASLIPGLGDGSQSEVTLLGPYAGYGIPFGVPTGDGLRNSSVDLGGGERFKIGGVKLSTGTSVQDYGLNPQRNSSIVGIKDRQSTEFGQGLRREPIYSSNTTDFGFPYRQFIPANENPQKQAQLLPPTAIETNF